MSTREDLPEVLAVLVRQSVAASYRTGADNGMVIDVYGGAIDGWREKQIGIGPGESQAPLNLPARELYLEQDEHSVALRAGYRAHIERMLGLAGRAPQDARTDAEHVLSIETALAAAMPSAEDAMGEQRRFLSPRSPEELRQQYPHFDWSAFLRRFGAPSSSTINLGWLPFFERWDALVDTQPLEAWHAYLRFHLLTDRSRFLPAAFRETSFDFFGRTVDGRTEAPARWRECVGLERRYLPDPLSRVFLERAASPRLVIRADDFYGNARRAAEAQFRRNLDKPGAPVSLDEWGLPPIWVGGFYDPAKNAVAMTAAQLLFFAGEEGTDLAALYGGLGSFIGHELSHGFDPLGSQYDTDGRLRPWWSKRDHERYEQRTQCVAKTYSQLDYPTGDRVRGEAVVGEQSAELMGHQLALAAYRRASAGAPEGVRDGLSAEQRFFVSAAQFMCLDASPEVWRQLVDTDPHAFGPPGVTGTVLNMPGFTEAFACRPGQAMVRPVARMCRVW
jgi:predicted metalloendopeptidase